MQKEQKMQISFIELKSIESAFVLLLLLLWMMIVRKVIHLVQRQSRLDRYDGSNLYIRCNVTYTYEDNHMKELTKSRRSIMLKENDLFFIFVYCLQYHTNNNDNIDDMKKTSKKKKKKKKRKHICMIMMMIIRKRHRNKHIHSKNFYFDIFSNQYYAKFLPSTSDYSIRICRVYSI